VLSQCIYPYPDFCPQNPLAPPRPGPTFSKSLLCTALDHAYGTITSLPLCAAFQASRPARPSCPMSATATASRTSAVPASTAVSKTASHTSVAFMASPTPASLGPGDECTEISDDCECVDDNGGGGV
jgi:hypothetical protein